MLAEERVQDVFVALYKNMDKLHAQSSLDGYLFISLRNRIFSHHQQLLTRKKHETAVMQSVSTTTDTVSDELDSKQLHSRLQERIEQLPPKCKDVFLLSREGQLSHKEIAEHLNISINTVDQHIQKALRMLRETVDDYNHAVVSILLLFIGYCLI